MTDRARNESVRNGVAPDQPSLRAASLQPRLCAITSASGAVREQACDGQWQLSEDLTAVHDDDATPELAEARNCSHHVPVIHPDDDDVVRVVRHGRRERPSLQTGAAHEAEADPARPEVTFDHGDLREIPGRVGDRGPVHCGRLLCERLSDDLIRHEPDHSCLPAAPGNPQIALANRLVADGMLDPLGHVGLRDLLDRSSPLQRELGLEALEIRQEQEVGLVAGGDCAEMPEPVPARGIDRGKHDGIFGRDAGGNRLTHHAVDVAVLGDVLRVAVVRAERDAVGSELLHQRQQGVKVARHRRFADQQPHAVAKALASFLRRERLVVGANPRRCVRVQRLSEETWRMPVDMHAGREPKLLELGVVRIDDAREIHHLREAEHAPPAQKALEIPGQQRTARRLENRGRDRRRRHEVEVERQPSHASSSQCTPSVPRTFASSCGSSTTAVVPSGRTRRANSSGRSFVDSRCMCASMNPGTTCRPDASTTCVPS